MIPDPATVARRRHAATIVVRLGLLLWGLLIMRGLGVDMASLAVNSSSYGSPLDVALFTLLARSGEMISWVAALVLHKRLVRWVVPMGVRMDVCPTCGYSLKNLESPVCPECGTNLRAPAQAPTVPAAPVQAPAQPPRAVTAGPATQATRTASSVQGVGAVEGPVAAPTPRPPKR